MDMASQCIAVMGGGYGNVPALRACLADAAAIGCDTNIFLGDAVGCCGHSDEIVDLIRGHFDVLIAGNLDVQAAAGADTCGCGYASPEDERVGCQAHALAMDSLSEDRRAWLGTLREGPRVVEFANMKLLLCHGSPDTTNEFLYESEIDEERIARWLHTLDAKILLCTHTGLPWVRRLADGRVACNVGVVGKPDHDGDPAVHYATVRLGPGEHIDVEIRRVEYDHESWAGQLDAEGVPPIFVEPLRTGVWTTGVASLPEAERSVDVRGRGWSEPAFPAGVADRVED